MIYVKYVHRAPCGMVDGSSFVYDVFMYLPCKPSHICSVIYVTYVYSDTGDGDLMCPGMHCSLRWEMVMK